LTDLIFHVKLKSDTGVLLIWSGTTKSK